jgi:hypothetical protein
MSRFVPVWGEVRETTFPSEHDVGGWWYTNGMAESSQVDVTKPKVEGFQAHACRRK